jgi:hypothetical protein
MVALLNSISIITNIVFIIKVGNIRVSIYSDQFPSVLLDCYKQIRLCSLNKRMGVRINLLTG